jgi:hypothetical protein
MNHEQHQQLALSCVELAREIAHGPAFFNSKGELTDAVVRYTGGRVTQDAERCVLAGALRLLHYSDRQIAKAVGCDVRSIPLMVRQAESSGRIPALKERLQAIVSQNAEQSSIVLAQLLDRAAGGEDSIELSAMVKAVGQVNSFQVDKHQILTGAATEIIEVRVGAGMAEREAWAKANAIPIEAIAAPVDYESSKNTTKPKQIEGNNEVRHNDDTTPDCDRDQVDGTQDTGGGVGISSGTPETPMV